jgi:exonuclease III
MNKANIRRRESWEYLLELNPDVALLQEVNLIPDFIENEFDYLYRKAIKKNGQQQHFGTAILVKGKIITPIQLSSELNWVNEELNLFSGNLVAAEIMLPNEFHAQTISVHAPAWCIDTERLVGADIADVKLKNNPKVWGTELVWAALCYAIPISKTPWIVGGDFNSSPTFDYLWKGGPRGNQEFLDRMNALELVECLFHSKGVLTPTFKNATDKKVIHQIDHLFVSAEMISSLESCKTGDSTIFDNYLSDHLPIIADFSV